MADHLEKNPSETGDHGSLTRSTVHGVFWITATRVIKVPLNLITVAVLARLLTPADFGIVAIGMLVKTLSDVLVDGSFGMVLIQRRTINAKLIGASLALSVILAALFAGVIVLGAPFIQREFDFPQLGEVLIVMAAVLPITAITTITTALLQRSFKFAALTVNALVSQLGYTAVAISLALAGYGLWSLVFAQLAAFVIEATMGFLAVGRSYQVGFSTSAFRDVLGSGGMFTLSKLLNWAASSVDRIVIGRFLGAAELGFYTRAASLMKTARQLTGTGPIRVLFSSFSKIQHDEARMRNGYLRALSVSMIVAALVSTFAIVNAEILVRLLLGPRWLPTVPLIQILFSAYLARSGYIVAEAIPLALGLGGQSALRQGAQLVLILLGAGIGAQFGAVGAAIGIAAAFWLFYLLCLLLVRRLLHVDWLETLRVHGNAILVAMPPAVAALATRWLLSADNLLLQMLPAVVFGVVTAIVLVLAPAKLIGGDLVRARTHVWERISPRVPGFKTRG